MTNPASEDDDIGEFWRDVRAELLIAILVALVFLIPTGREDDTRIRCSSGSAAQPALTPSKD